MAWKSKAELILEVKELQQSDSVEDWNSFHKYSKMSIANTYISLMESCDCPRPFFATIGKAFGILVK